MVKEAIREELKEVREEIRKFKTDFYSKKSEKEGFFSQGEEFSEEINKLYEEVKAIEKEHNLDKINEELEEQKVLFDKFKGELEILQVQFEKVKKNPKVRRPAIKTNSLEKVQKQIADLDLKLQTQVLSLEKESELIKKISELKEKSGLSSQVSSNDVDDFKQVRRQLSSVKKKFISSEKKIRSLYKQIRLISKEKKKKYKQIDELRDLKKKAFEEFRSYKKDYTQLGKTLKGLFKKEEEFLEKLGESPMQQKKAVDRNFKVKQKAVEDKLTKTGSLTTEDLLMFQANK